MIRSPFSFEDAIAKIIGALGRVAAAAAAGRSPNYVYEWGNEDNDKLPTIKQALDMDAAFVAAGAGEPPILAAYHEQLKRVTSAPHLANDPDERFLGVMSEIGDVAGELRASIRPESDGGVTRTPAERNRICAEIDEAIEALNQLKRDVDAETVVAHPAKRAAGA